MACVQYLARRHQTRSAPSRLLQEVRVRRARLLSELKQLSASASQISASHSQHIRARSRRSSALLARAISHTRLGLRPPPGSPLPLEAAFAAGGWSSNWYARTPFEDVQIVSLAVIQNPLHMWLLVYARLVGMSTVLREVTQRFSREGAEQIKQMYGYYADQMAKVIMPPRRNVSEGGAVHR